MTPRTPLRFFPAAAAALVAALAVSACGGDGESSGETVPADADVVVRAVDGIRWEQSQYTAAAGDILIATVNESSLPHNLVVIDADGNQSPGKLDIPSRGDVDSGTFPLTAGTYVLQCTIPGHGAMKADLVVE